MTALIHLLTTLTAVFLALMALLVLPTLALILLFAFAPSGPDCSVDAVWSKAHLSINGNCREIPWFRRGDGFPP
jgi:hypothetical protein